MQDQLGQIEIDCEAPSYVIVRACVELGFENPLDVRWLRLDPIPNGSDSSKSFLTLKAWTDALGLSRPMVRICSCGQRHPKLDRCTFILRSGLEVNYLLGQCQRCKTVFWQQL